MSRRVLAAFVAAVLLVSVPALVFAQNPLRGGGSEQAQLYDGPVPRFIVEWSRALQQAIASLSRRVLDGEWIAAVSAFLLSIVFGVVHIAGPGHGKVFAVSYFAGRDARPRDGLAYSAVVNAVDSLSAALVVMVGYVALRAVLPEARDQAPRILQLVSYALIVVFGVAHLVGHLRGSHEHGDADGHGHSREPALLGASAGDDGAATVRGVATERGAATDRGVRRRPPWLLAVSVGLVPCPVSTILLVYGVANDVLLLMLLMVVGVSVGGFLTMSVIAIAVITGRSTLLRAVRGPTAARAATILEYSASGAIIALGAVLLLSVL